MKRPLLCASLLMTVSLGTACRTTPSNGQLEVVPSFEAASYYYTPADAAPGATFVAEFRRAGESQWQRTFTTYSDNPEGVWKGSVLELSEDAAYELRLLAGDGDDAEVVAEQSFQTWTSQPPIARTIDLSTLPDAENGIVITDQGTPDGWIKYTAPKGWTMRRAYDAKDPQDAAIVLHGAKHVIIEGITIVGGLRHGILIDGCEAVRILNCDLSDWGQLGEQKFSNDGTRGRYFDEEGNIVNFQSAISINESSRTVVERCYIHDARGRSCSWMFAHPGGPGGIAMINTKGGNVLRWNDLVGSDEHRFDDVIQAKRNDKPDGGFYRDSDVSGNFLAFGNDDGVELEGGGMNVRFYRNKIEGVICSVSSGANFLGPQFIYGNLIVNPGDESGLALWLFKNSHGKPNFGRRIFLNNTAYGPDCGAYGGFGGTPDRLRAVSRNNVVVAGSARRPGNWVHIDDNDNDLFWIDDDAGASRDYLGIFQLNGRQENGIAEDPQLADPQRGDFHLAESSVARGKAAGLDNICPPGADLGAYYGSVDALPYRPLALRATPAQLNFAEADRGKAMTVTLTAADAEQPIVFDVRQNRDFDWFSIEPASGVVKPGESLELSVKVDAAKLSGRPLFRGAFLVRTPEGLSRPVTVYADGTFEEPMRPDDAPDSVYINVAEVPALASRLNKTDLPGVPGDIYAALDSKGKGESPEIDVKFKAPRDGEYSLLLRAGAPSDSSSDRRLRLTLNDAEPVDFGFHGSYQWNEDLPEKFRVIYLYNLGELKAGTHRLRLKLTANTLDLSELIVTDKPQVFFHQYWHRPRQ